MAIRVHAIVALTGVLLLGGCSRVSPTISDLPLDADPQAIGEFEKLTSEIQRRCKTPLRRLARAPEGYWLRTETNFDPAEAQIVESEPLTGRIKVAGHVTTWLKKKPKPDGTFDARDKRFASEAQAMDAKINVFT